MGWNGVGIVPCYIQTQPYVFQSKIKQQLFFYHARTQPKLNSELREMPYISTYVYIQTDSYTDRHVNTLKVYVSLSDRKIQHNKISTDTKNIKCICTKR